MLKPLLLKDDSEKKGVGVEYMDVLDRLGSGSPQMLRLRRSRHNSDASEKSDDKIVWYDPIFSGNYCGKAESLRVSTSHYVGTYEIKTSKGGLTRLDIKPRFGNAIFNYLLSHVSGVYIPPKATSSISIASNSYGHWLLLLLWKAAFDKALTVNHIPRIYVARERNLKTVRGRILPRQNLRENLTDQSRIYCKYRELAFDNIINRTIRYSYKLLRKHANSGFLQDVSVYDSKLASLGVSDGVVDSEQIRNITYTPMNSSYRLLMEVSQKVIANFGATSVGDRPRFKGRSFFVDVAELWENYIYRLLKRHFSDKFLVVSPNFEGERHYLLKGQWREIRPDILMIRNGKIVAVLDAKYKSGYFELGATEIRGVSVSREDLYQMTTYLWNLRQQDQPQAPIVGLFVSPREVDGQSSCGHQELTRFVSDEAVSIGLINLCIPKEGSEGQDKKGEKEVLVKAKQFEKEFCENVQKLLCPVI